MRVPFEHLDADASRRYRHTLNFHGHGNVQALLRHVDLGNPASPADVDLAFAYVAGDDVVLERAPACYVSAAFQEFDYAVIDHEHGATLRFDLDEPNFDAVRFLLAFHPTVRATVDVVDRRGELGGWTAHFDGVDRPNAEFDRVHALLARPGGADERNWQPPKDGTVELPTLEHRNASGPTEYVVVIGATDARAAFRTELLDCTSPDRFERSIERRNPDVGMRPTTGCYLDESHAGTTVVRFAAPHHGDYAVRHWSLAHTSLTFDHIVVRRDGNYRKATFTSGRKVATSESLTGLNLELKATS